MITLSVKDIYIKAVLQVSCCILLLMSSCKNKQDYDLAKVTTNSISNKTETSVTCSATVTDEGSYEVTTRGFVWNTTGLPIITSDSISENGEGKGDFSYTVTDLTPSTLYYIRAYATNKVGTKYGGLFVFWTYGPPVVSSNFAVDVTSVSSTISGTLVYDGGEPVTSMGMCYGTNENPSLDDNVLYYNGTDTTFTFVVNDLLPQTTYYYRSFATSSKGTSYSNQRQFNTLGGYVDDVDNNTYEAVRIGSQLWLSSNLTATHYNDNTPIAQVKSPSDWVNLTSPAWCYYNNADSCGEVYGALYNWYAVNNGNLCPTGWRLPSDADWQKLDEFVGYDAANKLKSTDDTYWYSTNGATNETNFNALGGGYRNDKGVFSGYKRDAAWWSSDESSTSMSYLWEMTTSSSGIARSTAPKTKGASVRCVKDMEEN